MSLGQFDETQPLFDATTFDSTYTPNTFVTLGSTTQGSKRYDGLYFASNATTSPNLTVQVVTPSGTYHFYNLGAGSGPGYGNVALNGVLQTALPTGQQFILLPPNSYVQAALDAAPGAGETITVMAVGGLV